MSRKQGKQGHWSQIKCPFFHSDDSTSINCEGFTDNSSVRQIFPNKEIRINWEKRYCYLIKGCELCPVYINANKKYNNDGLP